MESWLRGSFYIVSILLFSWIEKIRGNMFKNYHFFFILVITLIFLVSENSLWKDRIKKNFFQKIRVPFFQCFGEADIKKDCRKESKVSWGILLSFNNYKKTRWISTQLGWLINLINILSSQRYSGVEKDESWRYGAGRPKLEMLLEMFHDETWYSGQERRSGRAKSTSAPSTKHARLDEKIVQQV